ncbi:hypothetical protein GCM10023322_78930 [Rugosimonospora acidiphila]|uniref:HicB family protein n=1 Tax=Rugosimonospora acidiphila TaxID=556531 RepID=A0ABP9SRI9_9ACTN
MDLTPYIERVRQGLLAAADAIGEEGRALAERLVVPLDSEARLALLGALSEAADEITGEMAPGSVDLRLRGLDPSFVVTVPPADPWSEPSGANMAPVVPATQTPGPEDEGATARINFRPPEQLKARIEEAAAREGLSVNAWLVRAVGEVLDASGPRDKQRRPSGGRSFTGWVR